MSLFIAIIALKTDMNNEIMALKSEIDKHKECTKSSSSNSYGNKTQIVVPLNNHDVFNEIVENRMIMIKFSS